MEMLLKGIYLLIGLWIINFTLMSVDALAQPPIVVDPQTGKYLGNLNRNPHDPNSVYNQHGRYGNPHGNTVANPYGRYGGQYQPGYVAPVIVPQYYGGIGGTGYYYGW